MPPPNPRGSRVPPEITRKSQEVLQEASDDGFTEGRRDAYLDIQDYIIRGRQIRSVRSEDVLNYILGQLKQIDTE